MKRNLFLILLVVIGILLVIVWPRSRHQSPTESSLPAADTAQPGPQSVQSQGQSTAPNGDNSVAGTEASPMTQEERLKKKQEFADQYKNEWRTPIEFYGMVVDESNNPVSDVQIDFSCNDLSPTGTTDYHTASDGNGLFSLKNITGKLLVINNISKEGYYTSKEDNTSFEYGDSHLVADPNQPVIFHLRKKKQGADLVVIDYPGFARIAQLKHDGTPIDLDLFKGVPVAAGTGQLKLEFWRDLSDRNAKFFDWKLQISIPNGGLVGTDEEFPFMAPENGYQPSIVMDMQTNDPNWQGNMKTKYYFQLPDGKYGRFDFEFLPHNGVFTVHSAINTDGTRYLEPKQ